MMSSGMDDDPLTVQAEGDDAGSVSSQRSDGGGRSLLERIQMQRQREAAAAMTTPQQIQVPNYGLAPPGIGNGAGGSVPSASDGNFFSNAWSNLSQSMETNMAAPPSSTEFDYGMEDALLPPSAMIGADEGYSMSNYFLTFVKDVYGLFMRLHVVPRVLVVAGLLYVAIKLL